MTVLRSFILAMVFALQASGAGASLDPHQTQDPYLTLGVSRQASAEEINEAYRRLLKRYHPDLSASSGVPREVGETVTRNLVAAFEILKKSHRPPPPPPTSGDPVVDRLEALRVRPTLEGLVALMRLEPRELEKRRIHLHRVLRAISQSRADLASAAESILYPVTDPREVRTVEEWMALLRPLRRLEGIEQQGAVRRLVNEASSPSAEPGEYSRSGAGGNRDFQIALIRLMTEEFVKAETSVHARDITAYMYLIADADRAFEIYLGLIRAATEREHLDSLIHEAIQSLREMDKGESFTTKFRQIKKAESESLAHKTPASCRRIFI